MMHSQPYLATRKNSQKPSKGRRNGHDQVGVSFKVRILVTFAVLVAMVCFVVIVSFIAVRTKHRRLRRPAAANTYVEIKKAVELDEEIPPDEHNYIFVENQFTETERKEKLFVCRSKDTYNYHVLLFTCLPPNGDKRETKIAENTIKTWSALKPNIKPVLLVPRLMLNNHIVSKLTEQACNSGFDVLYIENNVKDFTPVLRSMFGMAYEVYDNATWYGYADFRQIFDSSLSKGLHMIEHHPGILKRGNLIVGKSHQFEVGTESLSPDFPDLMDLGTMVQELYYFDATEEAVLSDDLDYYFTTRYGFPWDKIPALIIGSEYADKFLMWYSMKNTSILAVDATDAIFTLRQYYASEKNKSRNYQLKAYNDALLIKWKYPQYYKKGLGTIKCLEYKLTNHEMPYYILIKRTRKYIRRIVRNTKPVTLSYYCKFVNEDNVAFIDSMDASKQVQECGILKQVQDFKKIDRLNAH